MQFIDEAKIYVKSGDGGDGCVAFRREANVPRGGPNGGNGGRGGDIILRVNKDLNTLIDFRYTQHFRAKKGENGKGDMRNGKASDDIIIDIPLGTQIFSDDQETLLMDITNNEHDIITLLKGGDGGFGNAHFKTSTNRAPRRATKGWGGEDMWIWLKLKLMCDVGLVGMPNAGKSTFLSIVTRAKPKIADYPFTTLKPKLGVCYIDNKEFVISDIPGLIEGAHEGHGLGHRFLKHVERSRTILHLVDITDEKFVENYFTIRRELELYSSDLAQKKEVVALNKIDSLDDELTQALLEEFIAKTGIVPHVISAIAHKNTDKLLRNLLKNIEDCVAEEKALQAAEEEKAKAEDEAEFLENIGIIS